MTYLTGAAVALAVLMLARFARFDEDRALYPVMLIVIASYYELFAAMGGPAKALWLEAAVVAIFILIAFGGFRRNMWLIVFGMTAHALFDALHPRLIENYGVPVWWPGFCLAFDLVIAAVLAARLFTEPSFDVDGG